MPLIYSGQEAGMNKRLRFFDKDTIEWKKNSMRQLFTKLNHLKKVNKALWNGTAGGEMIPLETNNSDVFAFTRTKNENKIFAVFNFSNNAQKVMIDNQAVTGNYKDAFTGSKRKISANRLELELKPWEYILYSK